MFVLRRFVILRGLLCCIMPFERNGIRFNIPPTKHMIARLRYNALVTISDGDVNLEKHSVLLALFGINPLVIDGLTARQASIAEL